MNGDVYRYIYIERFLSFLSLARSSRPRLFTSHQSPVGVFLAIFRCFYAARFAAACFLLLLFHFLAFGGGREPPLASRASILYFFFYRFNLADS